MRSWLFFLVAIALPSQLMAGRVVERQNIMVGKIQTDFYTYYVMADSMTHTPGSRSTPTVYRGIKACNAPWYPADCKRIVITNQFESTARKIAKQSVCGNMYKRESYTLNHIRHLNESRPLLHTQYSHDTSWKSHRFLMKQVNKLDLQQGYTLDQVKCYWK